jgi:hypothetical protein
LLGPSLIENQLIKISEFFDRVGINTTILTPPDVWGRFQDGNFDLFRIGRGVSLDPDEIWWHLHPNSSANNGNYSNKVVTNLIESGRQTPVKQEREYHYNELQWLLQEEAPYVFLTDRKLFYAVSTDVSPYVSLNRVSEFVFQYSVGPANVKVQLSNSQQEGSTGVAITKNVEIMTIPTYCPSTDAVVTTGGQERNSVTVKMTHQLQNFISTQNLVGKFFEIIPENNELEVKFRSYYDVWEIKEKAEGDLALWKWDNENSEWIKLTPTSSNKMFRYVEVILKGYSILKLGKSDQLDEQIETNQVPSIEFLLVIIFLCVSIIWRRKNY